MRKRKTFGRMAAMLLAATLMVGMASSARIVEAAEPETSKAATLTVYKYDGKPLNDSTNLSQKEMKELVDQGLAGNKIKPLEGVEFSYLRVGDYKQKSEGTGAAESTGVDGFSVSDSVKTLLGLTNTDVTFSEGGTDYYSTKALGEKLGSLNTTLAGQNKLEQLMITSGTKMAKTDTQGKATANLGTVTRGLYLVAETVYPTETTITTQPFFVPIPLTDVEQDGTTNVLWDVVVYPKNTIGGETVDPNSPDKPSNLSNMIQKSALINGNETKVAEAQIGQDVEYRIRVDVPVTIGKIRTYKVLDTMSEGLTFNAAKGYKVYGINAAGTRTQLTQGTEFTFNQAGQNLTFTFTPSKLADADKVAKYTYLEVEYKATVNEKASTKPGENKNAAKVEYSKNTDPNGADTTHTATVPTAKQPSVNTFAVDLLKYGDGNEASVMKDVTFKLLNNKGTEIKVAKATDGTYYVDANGTETLTTGTDGKLLVKGLGKDVYYLEETKTNAGYNLLKEKIKIELKSTSGEYEVNANGTYAPYEAGKTYYLGSAKVTKYAMPEGITAGQYINFDSTEVYTDAGKVTMYAPKDYTFSSNFAVDEAKGQVKVKVNNSKGFELPRTGGSGTTWFMVVGGILIIAAGIIIILAGRKKTRADR